MRHRSGSWLVLAGVAALVLSACGPDDDDAAPDRSEAAPIDAEDVQPEGDGGDGSDHGDGGDDSEGAAAEADPDEPQADPDEPQADPDEPQADPDEPQPDPDEDAERDQPDEDRSTRVVEVYFMDPDEDAQHAVAPVERTVPTPEVLHGALTALLEGPNDEERAEGYTSWFSAETRDLLRSVELDGGIARVDFDGRMPETIPNASTSAGSLALLAQLDATVTQFPTVDEAIYSLDGDVDAFYHWLQLSPPAE